MSVKSRLKILLTLKSKFSPRILLKENFVCEICTIFKKTIWNFTQKPAHVDNGTSYQRYTH